MTCYHPIRALIVGETDSGKKKLRFVSKDYDNKFKGKPIWEETLLPCGKCIGCTVERSRQWANRMMLELKYHDRACFITLTYNDDNLPLSHYVDSNGEEKISHTLVKRDMQLFMKRLRKRYQPKEIRFFGCGEYGGKTHRPHYHLILFGVDFSEKRYVYEVRDGYINYRSPILEELWPFGFSMICDVNWNTCAYVSRYCTKKKYGKQNIYYQTFNIEPEFNLMSRRPGIGAKYFEEHGEEVYINQEIFLQNNKGGFKTRPPTYYDRLYDIEHPEEMEVIKKQRKEIADEVNKQKLAKYKGMNLFEMLEIEETKFKTRISSLKREKI